MEERNKTKSWNKCGIQQLIWMKSLQTNSTGRERVFRVAGKLKTLGNTLGGGNRINQISNFGSMPKAMYEKQRIVLLQWQHKNTSSLCIIKGRKCCRGRHLVATGKKWNYSILLVDLWLKLEIFIPPLNIFTWRAVLCFDISRKLSSDISVAAMLECGIWKMPYSLREFTQHHHEVAQMNFYLVRAQSPPHSSGLGQERSEVWSRKTTSLVSNTELLL